MSPIATLLEVAAPSGMGQLACCAGLVLPVLTDDRALKTRALSTAITW
jgi:hypothetical protein